MNEAQKQQAESLFLNTEKSQKEIAAQVGIDPKTLYRWMKEGRWQQLRSATRRMPSILVENIYLQLDDLNYSIAQRDRGQRHPTKDESLTISRLMNSIGKVKKETSEGQNIEFLMNLINYVQPKNDELAKTLTEYGSAFLKDTNPKGFHPYDIEYDEVPAPSASLRGTKQSHDNTETVNANELELRFPPAAVTLSFGEGRAEASIGHESGIEKNEEKSTQQTENQAQNQETPAPQMPGMPENNFPEDRAQQEAPPLFLGEVPEGGRGQLAQEEIPPLTANSPAHSAGGDVPETTNVVSDQGDVSTMSDAPRPNGLPGPAKEPSLPPKSRYDRKFVYPGSGVHYLREHKDPTPPLSKEEYDALFRPGEHKKHGRNDKW